MSNSTQVERDAADPAHSAGKSSTGEGERPRMDPRQVRALRARLHDSMGKVALIMMSTPRYRNLPIADLQTLVLEPMLRDCVALASPRAPEGEAEAETLAGVAIWASVDEATDARIREQIRNGVFPIRLAGHEWRSGSIHWLLDVIAPNRDLATAVLAGFRQSLKSGELRLHPVIRQIIDIETLKQMGAAELSASQAGAA